MLFILISWDFIIIYLRIFHERINIITSKFIGDRFCEFYYLSYVTQKPQNYHQFVYE